MMKKLEVEFESDINKKSLRERKYTLTHSDETGQRHLYIGAEFNEEKCNKLRDEVIGNWSNAYAEIELHIKCNLYSEYSSLTIEERYDRFKKHMPRAITAIINGDKEYIIANNLLGNNVYVYFLSDLMSGREYYNRVNDYI
jgi:hypothetical protein